MSPAEAINQERRVWRMVVRRVRWVTFLLAVAANAIVVALAVGYYARDYEARLEAVESTGQKNAANIIESKAEYRARLREIEAKQKEADEMAARLDERLIAIQRSQGRIENMIERLAAGRRP